MEGESGHVPQEVTAKELVDSSNSLESQLGKGWKDRSIFNSIDDVFTPDELNSINNRKVPEAKKDHTNTEEWVIEANNVFENNGSTYSAAVVEDYGGNQKVYVEGKIGEDTFYALAPVTVKKNFGGKVTVGFSPEKVGLITREGKVFSVDGLMREEGKETDMVFLASAGRKPGANFKISCEASDDVYTGPKFSDSTLRLSYN